MRPRHREDKKQISGQINKDLLHLEPVNSCIGLTLGNGLSCQGHIDLGIFDEKLT